ncbi:unnamed protein product [Lampetra planeri]
MDAPHLKALLPPAPASTAPSASQQLLPDGPCCPVCLDPFGRRLRPVPLAPCGHALCRGCSRRLLASLAPTDRPPQPPPPSLRCPLCRQLCVLPPEPSSPPPPHLVVVLPVDVGAVGRRPGGPRPPGGNRAAGDSAPQGDSRDGFPPDPAWRPVAEAWAWTSACRGDGDVGGGTRTGKGSGARLSAATARGSGDGGDYESGGDGYNDELGRGGGGRESHGPCLRHALPLFAMLLLGLALFVLGAVLRLRVSAGAADAAVPTARGP